MTCQNQSVYDSDSDYSKDIKILVKENQIIEEGQSLCVVEAMKMENTLVAPKQCTIKKINYKEGDTLSVDQVIMEFSFK